MNGTQRQGVQSINIRGMEGKRVKILVDGASQPGVFDGGPYSFINSSAVTVDPDMLKSVEIVKVRLLACMVAMLLVALWRLKPKIQVIS